MIDKFLDPKNDFAFKQVFGKEKNKDVLIAFLNDVLDHTHIGEVVEVEFLEKVSDPEIGSHKQSLVDVRCRDQESREYIVEMQVAKQPGFEKRAQYYASKAYSKQLMAGERYERLKEVIFIAITDYIVFPEKEQLKSDHIILDKVSHAHDLKDLYFTFIELPKFTKSLEELQSPLDYWCYYFRYAPKTKPTDHEKLVKEHPMIKRAYEALDQCYWSEAELNTYEDWLKAEMDAREIERQKLIDAKAESKLEGMKQGIEQTKLAIAKNMLQYGEPVDKISRWTGLSIQQIKQLK